MRPGWHSRNDILSMLREAGPIADTATAFRTVLTAEDERELRKICKIIGEEIKNDLEAHKPADAKEVFSL